jgi:hypothetical protein
MAPKGSCEVCTCQNFTGKAVPRSVGGIQVLVVGPWIQGHSILSLGANWLKINGGEGLEDLSYGLVTWQGQVGLRATPWWRWPMWPSGPKAPYHVYLPPLSIFCTIFAQILLKFLHTKNTPCTSGTRWIINKIQHMWWWFTSLYDAFGWNIDGQNRC